MLDEKWLYSLTHMHTDEREQLVHTKVYMNTDIQPYAHTYMDTWIHTVIFAYEYGRTSIRTYRYGYIDTHGYIFI